MRKSCGRTPYAHWILGFITATLITVAAWPKLGASNHLLACIALCTGTLHLFNRGRAR